MKIEVGHLYGQNAANEKIHQEISVDIQLPDDGIKFEIAGPFMGNVDIYRIDDDLVVLLKNGKIPGKLECSKCLLEKDFTVQIPETEQIYYLQKQKVWGEEDFVVDSKDLKIDIMPFLLQELLIHIPQSYVHQQGDCDKKMLQKLKDLESISPSSPLAGLKDLIAENLNTKKKS